MFNFLKKKKIIVTHDGKFHPDDVFATATLSLLMEKNNQPFKIIRTRDDNIIKNGDIVFDVGAKYIPELGRFDHHQKEGAGTRKNTIPYASFGLIWKHFGTELVPDRNVWQTIDDVLVCSIDAHDSGFNLTQPIVSGIREYTISDIVSDIFKDCENKEERFKKVVSFAKIVIDSLIRNITKIEEEKRSIVKAYEESPDKRVVIVDSSVHRESIWQAMLPYEEALFAVYQGENHDRWQVVALRSDLNNFANRKNLPSAWAGLSDEDLQKITGVDDAINCHRNLFLAFVKSKEGAIKLAKLALDN